MGQLYGFIQGEMENSQTTPEQHQPVVTFPTASAPKAGMPKWPFAAGGVLLILGIGGFFLMQSQNVSEETASPTPFVSGLSSIETPVPTEAPSATVSPTPSSAPVTDTVRASLAIEVQNGTGTAGDAGLAKKQLDTLGYKKVTTGNASDTSATQTVITYTSEVSAAAVAEITTAIESVFGPVSAQKGVLTGTTSVRVVTGPKKSGGNLSTKTATPTATAKATATPTPKPLSASSTPTATPTPKPISN